MSFAKARDLLRLAQMAAGRHAGVSLAEIAEEFAVDHRTAQRMARALEDTFPGIEIATGEDRRRRWRLGDAGLGRLQGVGDAELAALEMSLRAARREGREVDAGALERLRDRLLAQMPPSHARRAEADAEILTAMMREDGINGDLEPWDWRYYSEKRRQAEHDLDEAALKPYLSLDAMIAAAFGCANRLFGLEFTPLDLPLYHPDCRAWEVTRDGRHVAVFIGDYFARGSKRSGAWCSSMRGQAKLPQVQGPVVINVCNFAKGDPALLSYDDARTLFHEFGHALHHLLSDVSYESLSGTSVARDFVELPSQLYEHWLEVPEVLERYATHVETGAPMPPEMLDRLLKATTYDMGFQTVEYVASALVDLTFHEGAPPEDLMAAQRDVLDRLGLPHAITMRHASPHFAHVFSGDGYSSGYYSYMWSEVMDADAFAAFEEAGGAFDTAQARALERHILSQGGSSDPAELYTAFRGRLPGVEALLRGRGLAA